MIDHSEDIKRDAQIGFRVNKRLKEDLERLARADRRSLASYLDILLEAHVESKQQEEKRSAATSHDHRRATARSARRQPRAP